MKPIQFKGHTIILQKPPNMTKEECGELAILQINDECISCWRMSFWERIKNLFTGKVWIGILSGTTQPPIYLTTKQPFKHEQAQKILDFQIAKQEFATRLSKKYAKDAAQKADRLLEARIKHNDPRWNFCVENSELDEAIKFGVGSICGLKLHKK
jgi:hypothetical protein